MKPHIPRGQEAANRVDSNQSEEAERIWQEATLREFLATLRAVLYLYMIERCVSHRPSRSA